MAVSFVGDNLFWQNLCLLTQLVISLRDASSISFLSITKSVNSRSNHFQVFIWRLCMHVNFLLQIRNIFSIISLSEQIQAVYAFAKLAWGWIIVRYLCCFGFFWLRRLTCGCSFQLFRCVHWYHHCRQGFCFSHMISKTLEVFSTYLHCFVKPSMQISNFGAFGIYIYTSIAFIVNDLPYILRS